MLKYGNNSTRKSKGVIDMKKYLTEIRIVTCICCAIGWWGLIFPEIAMNADTYNIVNEDGTALSEEELSEFEDSEILLEILNANKGQIRFRSKLLHTASEYFQKR